MREGGEEVIIVDVPRDSATTIARQRPCWAPRPAAAWSS